jgi:hypothetical protein
MMATLASPVRAATEAAAATGQNRYVVRRRKLPQPQNGCARSRKRRRARAPTLAAPRAVLLATNWVGGPGKVARENQAVSTRRDGQGRVITGPSRAAAFAAAGAKRAPQLPGARPRARGAPAARVRAAVPSAHHRDRWGAHSARIARTHGRCCGGARSAALCACAPPLAAQRPRPIGAAAATCVPSYLPHSPYPRVCAGAAPFSSVGGGLIGLSRRSLPDGG